MAANSDNVRTDFLVLHLSELVSPNLTLDLEVRTWNFDWTGLDL